MAVLWIVIGGEERGLAAETGFRNNLSGEACLIVFDEQGSGEVCLRKEGLVFDFRRVWRY